MDIFSKVDEDLKTAMKAKDKVSILALRSLKSSLRYKDVSGKGGLTEEEVVQVVKGELKKRKEAGEAFKKAGREESAKKEDAEAKIIEEYMPEQISEEEIVMVVESKKKEIGASSRADMGKLMGAVMVNLKGKADGALVKKIVEKQLS